MAFMDWAVEVAAAHPELKGAFINADGEWLDILLADGTDGTDGTDGADSGMAPLPPPTSGGGRAASPVCRFSSCAAYIEAVCCSDAVRATWTSGPPTCRSHCRRSG